MDFGAEQLPLLSLIVIPAVGWLHRQLSKLANESIEQETAIDGLKLYVKNLDSAMARRSELDVLTTRIDSLSDRLERSEDTIDRLRNGLRK